MGRGTLLSEALKEGFRTTEQEIRDILLTLNRLGLVTVSRAAAAAVCPSGDMPCIKSWHKMPFLK